VAGLVGIQSFKASMRPEDKLGYVQAYKSQGQGERV
jgi:cation transport ATPase